jgi:hypothetical protein
VIELSARNIPIVTITSTSGEERSTGRMTTRSINAPPMNEIAIAIRIAIQTGKFLAVKNQTRYVEYNAISPCAKLRMPVVRKISTNASASDAYTAPLPMPIMSWVRKSDI